MKKLVLVLAIAAGLMADAASATPNPKGYVLGLQSMPTGFSIKSTKAVPLAAAAKESDYPVAELKSWGYISGYEADYTRDVTLTDMVSGAIEIESTASIYKNESGAAKSEAYTANACNKAPAKELSVGAKIGDEAHLCLYTKKSGGYTFAVYAVIWRHGVVKASVITAGIKGGVSPTEAVTIAKKQDKLIR